MKHITTTAAWQNLERHYQKTVDTTLQDLIEKDAKRFKHFSVRVPLGNRAEKLLLDYSKNYITEETLDLLVELAKTAKLREKIDDMFTGQPINITEHRAVLHTALRNRSNKPVMIDGVNVMPKVNAVLRKMRKFTDQVRNGEWLGYNGKPMTDIVNIGIGGSNLGPKMVCKALNFYGKDKLRCHFVSNIDGTQIVETLKQLNPETTLFVVASKTFSTLETLTNAETARDWLLKIFKDKTAVAKHFVAVSTHAERVRNFGIDPKNMFEFWDWVGGRYSIWSAIGLPVMLLIGMDEFEEFLAGAHDMDKHFRRAAPRRNMPVILALLGVWYRNFFHAGTYAVLPYDQYLEYLPAYLQQLDMESNGKSTVLNGEAVTCQTGPVLWGSIGTDGQHAFHQLLHQGTDLIPIDFIMPIKSLNPIGKHHELLFANCLAQSQALLKGKTEQEAFEELILSDMPHDEAKALAPHKIMPGNRPSNTILMDKLTPYSLGMLIALYEHKVFVQGVIWGINSFDQWGVELGKQLANIITPDLTSPKTQKQYDASTKGLIEQYHVKKGII